MRLNEPGRELSSCPPLHRPVVVLTRRRIGGLKGQAIP